MPRKPPKGEFRDRERSTRRLIDAVGEVLTTFGFKKLGVNFISKVAGLHKKLIYRYFDKNPDRLIEAFVEEKDYWINLNKEIEGLVKSGRSDYGRSIASRTLVDLFQQLDMEPEALAFMLWEVSEPSRVMARTSRRREALGSRLFPLTDPLFRGTTIDLRAIYALLLGGIYYLHLHARGAGGPFCGLNVLNEPSKQRIIGALKAIVSVLYEEARMQKERKRIVCGLRDFTRRVIVSAPPGVTRRRAGGTYGYGTNRISNVSVRGRRPSI